MELHVNVGAADVLTLDMLDKFVEQARAAGLTPLKDADLTDEDWHKIFNGLAILEEHLVLPPGIE